MRGVTLAWRFRAPVEWVEQIMQEHARRKYTDHDMCPKTYEIELRMVRTLSEPGNGPRVVESPVSACIGSSEAYMPAGLAHRWNWRKARMATG